MEAKWKLAWRERKAWVAGEFRRRRWLWSELTKVTWKPPARQRSLARVSMGFTWPCKGNGKKTTWGWVIVVVGGSGPGSIAKDCVYDEAGAVVTSESRAPLTLSCFHLIIRLYNMDSNK